MTTSVRVRLSLLRRCRLTLDEVIKRVSQKLSKHEVHSKSGANDGFKRAALNSCDRQGQMQVPIDVARINEKVGTGHGNRIILNNSPFISAYSKHLPIGQSVNSFNSLVGHQSPPKPRLQLHQVGWENPRSRVMTALLLKFWPYIAGAIVAAFSAWKLRQSGVNSERARQAKEKVAAAEDRLEMDREATEIERRVTGMSDDEARKEADRWARR